MIVIDPISLLFKDILMNTSAQGKRHPNYKERFVDPQATQR